MNEADFWRTFEDHALFLRYVAKRHGHYPEVAWLDQTMNTNPVTLAKFYAEWREKSVHIENDTKSA